MYFQGNSAMDDIWVSHTLHYFCPFTFLFIRKYIKKKIILTMT